MFRLCCPHCASAIAVAPVIGPATCPACQGPFMLVALPLTDDATAARGSWWHPQHLVESFSAWAAPLGAKLIVAACGAASLILVALALLTLVRRALGGDSLELFDELWWAFKALIGLLLCVGGSLALVIAYRRSERRHAEAAELRRHLLEAELQAAEEALTTQPGEPIRPWQSPV